MQQSGITGRCLWVQKDRKSDRQLTRRFENSKKKQNRPAAQHPLNNLMKQRIKGNGQQTKRCQNAKKQFETFDLAPQVDFCGKMPSSTWTKNRHDVFKISKKTSSRRSIDPFIDTFCAPHHRNGTQTDLKELHDGPLHLRREAGTDDFPASN